MPELIGLTEIAEILGMTRSGTDKLVKREASFPSPVATLAGRTRVWDRQAIENWAVETCRICPEHHHVAIGKQVVAGVFRGRCEEDFLYNVPPSMVPGERGRNARTPKIPEDL